MESNFIENALTDFYRDLEQISLPENAITFTVSSSDLLRSAHDENTGPLINICPPQVKAADFFGILFQVSDIIKKNYPDRTTEIVQIESALPVSPAEQEALVANMFIPGINLLASLPQELPADTFGLLFNHTVKLFMRQYVEKALPFSDLEHWHKGICPICGGLPSFALLEKDNGARYLYCGFCEIKWRFQRLGCPFCYSSASQFITVEGMEKYRIYVCDDCHSYIKTIDEKRTGAKEVNLFLEDINTLHLDLLAMREGYFNKQLGLPPVATLPDI